MNGGAPPLLILIGFLWAAVGAISGVYVARMQGNRDDLVRILCGIGLGPLAALVAIIVAFENAPYPQGAPDGVAAAGKDKEESK